MQQRLRVDGDTFENAPRVDADIFYTDKKDAFSKISGYVWTSLNNETMNKLILFCINQSNYDGIAPSNLDQIESVAW